MSEVPVRARCSGLCALHCHPPQEAEATLLLAEALHLGMHGENAPGGTETWDQWYRKAERYLRGAP